MSGMKIKKILMFLTAAILIVPMAACSGAGSTEKTTAAEYLTKEDITINQTYENDSDGEHAIEVSGETAEYSNIGVTKTGEAEGDAADFYGENSAVFATEKGTLSIRDSLIETDGTDTNAVFSYGH